MKDNHKKYKLHCKTLSPIHIGSGEVLSRWEYLIYNNKLYKPKDEFWTAWNKKSPDSINKIVDLISKDDPNLNFSEYFKVKDEKTLEKYFIKTSASLNLVEGKIRNINLFSGSPDYIIPGSSIKGAIRTGITVNELSKKLISVNNGYDGVRELQEEEKRLAKVDGPISKDFQSIYILDVKLDSENISINPISYLKDDKDFQLYETTIPESSFNIEVTNTLYRQNFDCNSVFQQASDFYRAIWNKLKLISKDSLNNFYKSKDNEVQSSQGLLRIGFGSGQLSNSILHFWKESGKSDIYLYNGNAKTLNKNKGTIFNPYPSTVKMANDMPLGWVLIEKIEQC